MAIQTVFFNSYGKKRIRLGLLQYKHLLTGLEDAVGPAFSENKDDKSHILVRQKRSCDSIGNLPMSFTKDQ